MKDYSECGRINIEEIFASKVFTLDKMKERLPADVYEEILKVNREGGELSYSSAETVANAMKEWAIAQGATHYTHWFQPLTGITAEKHDSFVTHPKSDGKMLLSFSAKELIKGEPDASSFPSGGLRSTFEARGYTVWDTTSPAFIKEASTGPILCIPTAFCSYTGEALDKKTPLLRSLEAINEQALRIVHAFGNTEAKKVSVSVGAEQEYFLIDRENYLKRDDLVFTGRTLFGAQPPKGQEMDDHYFGVIRERVGAFMNDLNVELWKLGVTAKTQHNEVAPAQHELAPIYEEANIATDHNQLVMETMKRVAFEHGLTCLLHEKPFAGVNGSGKHNNWSLVTDNGVNLLDPGNTPNENIQFLLILACIIKAVDTHADLLRQSASDVGNDHRLGASEAPPAIMSVFLGEQLDDVVRQLVETGEASRSLEGGVLQTGVSTLIDVEKDGTDRNRTSPFAFTGNKFEFRSVGSSDSIASPNTILNAIVAEAFCEAADRIDAAENFDNEVHDIIKEFLAKHQRIIFNGDGYSEEWVKEAERRGLPNLRNMVDAVDTLTTPKAIALFEKFGIFTRAELESREEILYESYAKTINIEALTMISMVSKKFIPAGIRYSKLLSDTVNAVENAGTDPSVQSRILDRVQTRLDLMYKAMERLSEVEKKGHSITDAKERAFYYRDVVRAAMDELRTPTDELETLVDEQLWPVPTYGDMLFEV
ncbi:MAG: glutamine synthetase III [Lachnospiraceae bacterium]|nr:glutamine synthetase III [Lachnospiraceae bacterium]